MKLLLATRNPDKLAEIRSLFVVPDLDVVSALDLPDLPEVDEDQATLEGNAIKKAAVLSKASGLWSLADDTGLEVEALDGAPGVYSARFAGASATYEDNVAKLLRDLAGADNRVARFRTVIALSDPYGTATVVDGEVHGRITTDPRGVAGFGYDPVFLPDGFDRTFAEMSLDDKNRISHRGIALVRARDAWAPLLATAPDRIPG